MNSEMDLMQRLAVSKKIMDKHNQIKRGDGTPMVESFETPNATYNLPQEYIQEQHTPSKFHDPSTPLDESRINNSRLPDEIKQLMKEHPIVQPQQTSTPTISDDVIAGAQRLMNLNTTEQQPTQQTKKTIQEQTNTNFNLNEMKSLIRDVVRDTVRDVVREELKEAGMLVESTKDVADTIQFKVGNTVFVGKITKVKNLKN
jgi:hypothetical protein